VTWVAPASSALSTSSRTTEAGRSTTSPAAIWLTSSSGSGRIGRRGAPPAAGPAGASAAVAARVSVSAPVSVRTSVGAASELIGAIVGSAAGAAAAARRGFQATTRIGSQAVMSYSVFKVCQAPRSWGAGNRVTLFQESVRSWLFLATW
jgi:hypothetical protein